MRITVFCAFFLVAGLLVGTPATVQAQIQLSDEQQRMLDQLPAAQRAEVLRQIRQAQQRQDPRTTVDEDDREVRDAERARRIERELLEEDELIDHRVIRPNDTLVIEVMHPDPDAERERDREPHILAGRHTVQLDRLGRLTMPGLDNIPLSGLDAEQAAMRLMAEPLLADKIVYVTRLTLTPIGRDALEPFGYTIFQRPVETLRPLRGMAVPSDYVVGPGDTVQIQLFGQEFASYTLVVTRDGMLHVPKIGPVAVAGTRYSQMKADIEQRIQAQTIGVRAAVSMGELRSIEVFVLGDVRIPGAHTVSSLSTILHALYASGGISRIGSLRDVRLLRAGEVVSRFDLYDLLLHGNARADVRLQSDDVIFVPATGPRVGVMGEIHRAAWYELKDGATVGQLIDFAGGGSVDADLKRVQLQRLGDGGIPEFVDVDATTRAGRVTRVRGGDVIAVPRAAAVAENAIRLRGHFTLTGMREWKDGLRLSDVLPDRSVLKDNPDLDYGLVVRRLPDGRGVSAHMFSPRRVLAEPSSTHDLTLQGRDEIYVFPFDDQVERRAQIDPLIARLERQATRDHGTRIVEVTGSVRAPGKYPLAEGMRMYDLIRAGGGLAEPAYLDTAEITRFEVIDGQHRRIDHREVRLDGIIDRDPAHDLVLQAHDVLNVKQTPLWTESGFVELRGEVRFPGRYPIRPGEMLSDVIARAGGMTGQAFPRAAVFTRQTLREREQEQIDQMIRRLEADVATAGTRQMEGDVAQAQAMARSLIEQLRRTRPAGRLVIDLPRLMDNPGDPNLDVIARSGDMLVVPQRPQEVTVMGEVYFPTSHIYDPGLSRNGYINRSGGATYRADEKRMYVVRADGSVEAAGRRGARDVRAGDTIVVPIDVDRVPPMVRLMNISQIVYQLGIAAAAWNTIGVF